MVLILSIPSDQSTIEVIKWLNHYNQPWLRIDFSQQLFIDKMELGANNKAVFQLRVADGTVINSTDLTAYWYRRSNLNLAYTENVLKLKDDELGNQFATHMQNELAFLKNGLHALLATLPHISDFRTADLNKIDVLLMAQKVGLTIPETCITTKKSFVEAFHKNKKAIVSKAIQNGHRYTLKDGGDTFEYLCYTEVFKPSELSPTFFPSLFQERLDKAIELRIFFLCGEFYPMAIFSQNKKETQTDFRHYDPELPSRNVPYELTEKLKKQLTKLMKELQLNSGSIDMVVTKSGATVFLEVNPVGQFGMVAVPCHYQINEQIALKLIKPDKWMKS